MDQQQQSRWRRIGRQILWTVGAVVAVSAVVFVLNHFFVHRPLWDWLKLLVVPAILAGGGLWFNAQQRDREQRTANERAQDEALQAYLDQMSGMLIPSLDQPSLYKARPGDSLSSVARARTLTVLPRLDGDRKARVVQFLYESGLISRERQVLALNNADLRRADLNGAFLMGADLSGADLHRADLRGSYHQMEYIRFAVGLTSRLPRGADVSWHLAMKGGASLSRIDLSEADLHGADLRGAFLHEAVLSEADLRGANLSGADLSWADLHGADLHGADLNLVILSGANLSEAYLSGAEGITNEELEQQARFLQGATMPDGQKYEDWLKDKESRGEDE